MAYARNIWSNNDPSTPLNGPRLNNMELGIYTADANATTALANAAAANTAASAAQTAASAQPVKISVTYKTAAAGYNYAVMRAYTGGRFVPGLVSKRYGGDFDATNPTSTGSAFIPPGESLPSYARRTGSTVATNASGWNVTNNFGEMRGIQIHNGIMYHDFENTGSGSPAGLEGLAMYPNGQLKCVSAFRGDTGAALLAAGVRDTWSYGPNLIVNGVQQDIDSNPSRWKYFAKTYSPVEISARTIIGQSQAGDIIIISTVGKTNVVGLTGNDMVTLAASEGMYNASTFDGGGSTQMWTQGIYTIPSSDSSSGYDGTVGQRKVGDCFLLTGNLATRSIFTPWIDLTLASGYQAYSGTQVPQIRQIDGVIEFRGAVTPNDGSNFGSSDVTVVNAVPQQFQNNQAAKSYLLIGNGDNYRKVVFQSNGSITVIGSPNSSPAYISLDGMRYSVDTW
jgi:hypothetical protein